MSRKILGWARQQQDHVAANVPFAPAELTVLASKTLHAGPPSIDQGLSEKLQMQISRKRQEVLPSRVL